MKWFLCLLIALTLTVALPRSAPACPSCQAAVDASCGEDDGAAETGNQVDYVSEAYNQNIYIMVGLPYSMLMLFGFFAYRGVKRNEDHRRAQGQSVRGSTQGESSSSHGEPV
jgi:hypothetical protein